MRAQNHPRALQDETVLRRLSIVVSFFFILNGKTTYVVKMGFVAQLEGPLPNIHNGIGTNVTGDRL